MNYTLKVATIRQETDDTITLCFKQPGLKKVKYLAGQYLTLIFRINGRRYARPYSFSSCPQIDQFLEVTVKRVPDGIVSNHIHDVVKEGDSIEVIPAMGDFTFNADKAFGGVYLWGVGSGITPLISIAKYILSSEQETRVILSYGNRNHDSTIFRNQITELESKYGVRFKVKHFHTKYTVEENNPSVIQGRIDHSRVSAIISNDADLSHSAHYICGPSGLKESVKAALSAYEIDQENIFSEDFELVKDPKDFEDIRTQTIILRFNDQDTNLEVTKGKSILEAALNANIELPYSCQTGNCSTCKGRLISGEARMIGLSHVREDLAQDEFLLCCSHPVTENVYIAI
jgi:ring-1,2-phenylacetyl-CoA epoxidase subunit PaaE